MLAFWCYNQCMTIIIFSLPRLCQDHFKYQGRKKIVTLSIIGESSMGRKANTLPSNRRSTPNGSLPPTFRSISQYGDFQPDVPNFHSMFALIINHHNPMEVCLELAVCWGSFPLVFLVYISMWSIQNKNMIQLMYTDLTFISSCIMFKISNPGHCVYMLAVQTMRSINR